MILCLTWLLVRDVHVEHGDASEGDDGRDPIDGEHHEQAEEEAQQGDPFVVVSGCGYIQIPNCSLNNT